MAQNIIYRPWEGIKGLWLCLMTNLLLFCPIWLLPFASTFSHFSDSIYSLTEIFLQTKVSDGGQGGGEKDHRVLLFHFKMTTFWPQSKWCGFKQQKCLSQLWRLEFWNQGVGRTTLPLKILRRSTILLPSRFWGLLAFPGWWLHPSHFCPPPPYPGHLTLSLWVWLSVSLHGLLIRTAVIMLRADPNLVWPHLN